MSSLTLSRRAQSDGPRLRLMARSEPESVKRRGRTRSEAIDRSQAPGEGPRAPRSPVLVVGRDRVRRVAVLEDLTQSMPTGTRFEEAWAFWQVLARAPESRMVIVSGELDDVPAGSLIRTLGQRHPDLPIVSVDAPARLAPCA